MADGETSGNRRLVGPDRPKHYREQGSLPADRIAEYIDTTWSFSLRLDLEDPEGPQAGAPESVDSAVAIFDLLGEMVDPLPVLLLFDVVDPVFRDSVRLAKPSEQQEKAVLFFRDPFPEGVLVRDDRDIDGDEQIQVDGITRLGGPWTVWETRLGPNIEPNHVHDGIVVGADRPADQLYDGTTRPADPSPRFCP